MKCLWNEFHIRELILKIKTRNECDAGKERGPENRGRRGRSPSCTSALGRAGRTPGIQGCTRRVSKWAREHHPQQNIRLCSQQAVVLFLDFSESFANGVRAGGREPWWGAHYEQFWPLNGKRQLQENTKLCVFNVTLLSRKIPALCIKGSHFCYWNSISLGIKTQWEEQLTLTSHQDPYRALTFRRVSFSQVLRPQTESRVPQGRHHVQPGGARACRLQGAALLSSGLLSCITNFCHSQIVPKDNRVLITKNW